MRDTVRVALRPLLPPAPGTGAGMGGFSPVLEIPDTFFVEMGRAERASDSPS